MDESRIISKESIAAPDSTELSSGQSEKHATPSVISASDNDDQDLQKLGYKSVLARGWGSFDNFACSFSALYCIGGIRVLFYIALSNGGPAAMYVHSPDTLCLTYIDKSLKMELVDNWKHPINYYCRHARRGLLYLPSCWIHLLLGIPVMGRRKARKIHLLLGSCLDPSSLDGFPCNGLIWCCQLSGVRGCRLQSRYDLPS